MAWKLFIVFVVFAFIPSIYLEIPDGDHELPLSALLEKINAKYDVNGDPLWEGDIVFSHEKERKARKNLNSRWPKGQIPYKIDDKLSSAEENIAKAMKFWTDNTCVNFVNSPTIENQTHLVLTHTGGGCYSFVGIATKYTIIQQLSAVAHELGHAIGLWHEQERQDRDDYLVVYKENMGKNEFKVITDVMHYDVPYDYYSLMHYTSDLFSANGRLTLVPRDPLAIVRMGHAESPTFKDYKMVNRMYNCSNGCNPLPLCGVGYATWNVAKGCRCECPSGFAGSNCQDQVYVVPPCGGKINKEQRIQTENYPNPHPAKLKCAWLIEAPPGKVPSVSFHDFHFLGRYKKDNTCPWDNVKVRLNDLLSDDPGISYCGTELLNKELSSESRQLLIMLTTTYDDFGRGFDMSIKFV